MTNISSQSRWLPSNIHLVIVPLMWFLLANAGVIAQAWLILSSLGGDAWLAARGIGLLEVGWGVLALSVSGTLVMLFSSRLIIRYFLGARMVDDSMDTKAQQLQIIVAELSRRAYIACPELAIYPDTEKNAFAVATGGRHAMLVLSQGLVDSLTLDELSAVIGHEITHIVTGDMLSLSLMQGVVNVCVYFPARFISILLDTLTVRRGLFEPFYRLLGLFLQLCLGGLTSLVVMWFSRRQEFRADAGGAHLAGYAEMMAALRSLQAGGNCSRPTKYPLAVFGINGSFFVSVLWQLFNSHPTLAERIEALRKTS